MLGNPTKENLFPERKGKDSAWGRGLPEGRELSRQISSLDKRKKGISMRAGKEFEGFTEGDWTVSLSRQEETPRKPVPHHGKRRRNKQKGERDRGLSV